MKKLLSVLITAAMLAVSLTAVYAENDISVLLDGRELEFDVPPQIIEERTFVPMRAIFEALGADVNWDDTTKTVTADKDGTEIIMTIGYELMFVNYVPVTLDAPPQIIGERTLVPVRAIAESFDCTVDWNSEQRTVIIVTAPDENRQNTAAEDEAAEEFPIEYDKSSEADSHSAGGFRLTHVQKNTDGKYEIEYYLQTYQDGSGRQMIIFDCLDDTDKVIDSFGDYFYNDAYNWADQTGSAVISGRTVKIRLSENNQKQ